MAKDPNADQPAPTTDPLRALVEQAGSLGTFGGVITVIASAATAALLGGIVFAIRLNEVGLPVEEALRVIPRETLVLVGARELLIAGVLAIVLLLLARTTLALALAVALIVALVSPMTFAGLAWPAAIVLVWVAARYVRQAMLVAVGTFVLACILTSVRYTDPPYAFSVAQVVRASDDAIHGCGSLEQSKTRICGAYLSRHNDGVYLGSPANDRIVFVPKEAVRGVILYPPPDHGSPRTSVFGRVAPDFIPRIDLTPLNLWVDGEHKGWSIFR